MNQTHNGPGPLRLPPLISSPLLTSFLSHSTSPSNNLPFPPLISPVPLYPSLTYTPLPFSHLSLPPLLLPGLT